MTELYSKSGINTCRKVKGGGMMVKFVAIMYNKELQRTTNQNPMTIIKTTPKHRKKQ